jgi:hypothetical protein
MGKGEKGFSLVELTMAAFLTVGVTAAVFVLMRSNQQVFVSEYGVKDMNENVRICIDLLTRDIQSAGAGLSRISTNPGRRGNFASIYYKTGADANTSDQLLVLAGDQLFSFTDVQAVAADSTYYDVSLPPRTSPPSGGAGSSFTCLAQDGVTQIPVYQAYSTNPVRYLYYDNTHAQVFTLTADAQWLNPLVRLTHNPASDINPAVAFGCPADTSAPIIGTLPYVAMLRSTIAYRLNSTTNELERTEDLNNWYAIARGILSFKVKYRLETYTATSQNLVVETISTQPGIDTIPGTVQPTRRDIRSVIITMEAETPDARPGDRRYRTETFKFEVTPRNLNLLNNNNLTYNAKAQTQPAQNQ